MKIIKFLPVICTTLLAGCASGWISDPSPQVRNTVHDLRLDGFSCKPSYSKIVCTEIEPLRSEQPALCSSAKGCVDQPDHLLYNVYEIKQSPSGVPEIDHDVVRRADKAFKPVVR